MKYKIFLNVLFLIFFCSLTSAYSDISTAEHGFPEPNPPFIERGMQEEKEPITYIQSAPSQEWVYHKTSDNLHPDGNEQQMMWLMNRARSDPRVEGIWLSNTGDSDVDFALDFFGVNITSLKNEFASYDPEPPAAFDRRLYYAAKEHSEYLISTDSQNHDGQFGRIDDENFNYRSYGGNVYSYAKTPLYGHAGFNVDWGNEDDGMQTGRAHRINLMSIGHNFYNVGKAVVRESDNGTQVGPLVITENYCEALTSSLDHYNNFIVGTVWTDSNGNSLYDPGEGMSGVTVTPDSGTYYAVTADSGGYAIPVTSQSISNVTFSGTSLDADIDKSVSVGPESVLLDVETGSDGTGTCTYTISSTSNTFDFNSGTGSVSVTATTGCSWTATSSDTSWLTIDTGSSGSGNGTVDYYVSANTGTTERTGTIVFSDADAVSFATLTISQEGATENAGTVQWPIYPYTLTPASITQYYADDSSGDYHTGIDMDTVIDANDTVRAVAGGKVRRLDMNENDPINPNNHEMGNVVIIDHSFGTNSVGSFFSLYAHLASIDVDDGAIIEKGDSIGTIGDTGCQPSCGKHLHLEFKSWNVLGNLDDELGPYWGYTPDKPNWYGYINPYPYLEYDIINISPTAILVTTTTEELLRTGPGIDYEETFGSVSDKQKFVAFSEYNGWYQVYIPSKYGPATGWIQGTVEQSATILEVNDAIRGTIGVCVRDSASKIGTCEEGNGISNVWDDQWVVHTGQTQTASGDGCGEQWYEIYLPDGLSSLTGWVCGEYLLVNDKVPAPDVKANSLDGNVTLLEGEDLNVTVSLDAGSYTGEDADWWVYATTSFGTYWYTLNSGWQPSNTPIRIYGGPLLNLSTYTVLNMNTLPVGNYNFNFEVDDNMDNIKDATYTDSVDVNVESTTSNLPTVTITSPSTGSMYTYGDSITFNGFGSDNEDGDLSGGSLVWTSSVDGQIGTGTSFTKSDMSVGTHTITLMAIDSEGVTGSDSVSIVVNSPDNTSPTATITSPSDNSTYNQGDSVTFIGTGYDTEDGNLSGTSLVWTSSVDGQIGTGTSFTKSDMSVGTHKITLTATDSEGVTGSDLVSIVVNSPGNTSPTATISPSTGSTYTYGDSITFNGSGSDNEDGTLSGGSLVWTSSVDGQIGMGTFFTKSDLSIGAHTITLTATDSEGATGSDSVNITVESIISSGTYNLPDTGQTESYTDTFGEDSDYTINPPSYTDNNNGTVKDNVTGLIWQQEDDDIKYTWYEATGTSDDEYNPAGAIDVCGSLTLAGYSDWRLPELKELTGIVDYGTYDPAIDETYFPNTNSSRYWSSTTIVYNTRIAWSVFFDNGKDSTNYSKPNLSYVRCIRGGPGNTSPTATISPSTGSTYTYGDSITFNGSGSDNEDGTLSGGSLVWTSSVDGQIGMGTSFTKSDLSIGAHTITLTATDSEGATGSDSVNITVESLISSGTYNLPDTGQTESYTDTFGEDSDYTINPPSYTDNNNGTVKDNVTGLIWQQEDDDIKYTWYEATGTSDDEYNPVGAIDVCGSLTLAGYSDWRLPGLKELTGIVDYGTYGPAIDETYFPNTNSSRYWSSTTIVYNTRIAWSVFFDNGKDSTNYSKPNLSYVRCIRGGQ